MPAMHVDLHAWQQPMTQSTMALLSKSSSPSLHQSAEIRTQMSRRDTTHRTLADRDQLCTCPIHRPLCYQRERDEYIRCVTQPQIYTKAKTVFLLTIYILKQQPKCC